MKLFYFKISIVIFAIFLCIPDLLLKAEENLDKKKYPPGRHFKVIPTTGKIKIDGVLKEDAWQEAVSIELPYEWSPGDNIPAPVKTECLVTYSNSKIFIAFRCFDPEPGKIRAHYMNRDAIDTLIQDDHVNIMFDTFNDEHRGFQFRVNPLGVQVDAINSPLEGYEDFFWDAIWNSAGNITDFGYVVEIAIPFNQLRFHRLEGKQTWGISAKRSYPRNVRHRICSHVISRERNCQLCQFNKITGFEGISPKQNLEFAPTLTFHRTDQPEQFPQGPLTPGKIKTEPGITAKWGITSNLTLNAAINPDFSHVEADAAQLEVNTRFALKYPEKRPFFLEGADFLLTPLEAVFTRTVYDPVWGIKTSGKIKGNAVSVFAVQDNFNNLIFPSNQESTTAAIKENVYGGVFRYRRDIGKGSTLGVLYTGRATNDSKYYNHVAGFDGFFQLSQQKTLDIQFLRSSTQYPQTISQEFGQQTEPFAGNALFFQLENLGRRFYYFAEYQDLSANFRADFGFIPRVDIRRMSAGFQPIIWGKQGGWFNKITLDFRGERITSHNNQLTNQDFQITLNYDGPLQSFFQQSAAFKKEFYNGTTYDLTRFCVLFSMKPMGGVNFFISARIGDSVDYSNSRLADSLLINPGMELGLGKHINLNLNHFFERLSTQGNRIYTANLLQVQAIYNFNVRTFVRAIVQYTHLDRNVFSYTVPIEPITKELFTQFLFSYKINPQTVFFIGYSDNHYGTKGIPVSCTDRTFFLKIGYALTL